MGKRSVSVSYLADVDTLFIHFESKLGYYDSIPDDDRVQARYDETGAVIGFMIEGLSDVRGWLDIELADEPSRRHKPRRMAVRDVPPARNEGEGREVNGRFGNED